MPNSWLQLRNCHNPVWGHARSRSASRRQPRTRHTPALQREAFGASAARARHGPRAGSVPDLMTRGPGRACSASTPAAASASGRPAARWPARRCSASSSGASPRRAQAARATPSCSDRAAAQPSARQSAAVTPRQAICAPRPHGAPRRRGRAAGRQAHLQRERSTGRRARQAGGRSACGTPQQHITASVYPKYQDEQQHRTALGGLTLCMCCRLR